MVFLTKNKGKIVGKINNRIHYLDLLRILATLAVIVIHVSSQNAFKVAPIASLSWQGFNFWDSLSRYSVPMFVMISGALFLNPDYKFETKKLFTKNIFRICCAFVFWDIFYAIYTYLFETHETGIIVQILIKGYSHLWFLPMIIGLYLLIPLLRKITADRCLAKYFLMLSTIFTLILPLIYALISVSIKYGDLPTALKVIFKSLHVLYTQFYFFFTLGFVSYFVAGDYFNRYELKKKSRYILYFLAIVSFIATFAITAYLSKIYQHRILVLYNYTYLNIAIETVAIFVFFRQLETKIDWNKYVHIDGIILKISNLTFGIYLVHFLFVRIFSQKFNVYQEFTNSFLLVPCLAIIIFIISGLVIAIVQKIPWLNRHIM